MSLAGRIAWDDTILPFQLDRADIRGRVARLDSVLETHPRPARLSGAGGGAGRRGDAADRADRPDDQAALEAQPAGPRPGPDPADRHRLFRPGAEGEPARMRAYAGFDAGARGRGAARPFDLLGDGVFAILIDQGRGTTPYQGITPIAGGSLADCAETYFAQSEQLPTRFALAMGEAMEPGGPRAGAAAGVMLQHMPKGVARRRGRRRPGPDGLLAAEDMLDGADAENWRRAVTLLETVEATELIGPHVGAEAAAAAALPRGGAAGLRARSRCASAAPAARRRWCDRCRSTRPSDIADMTTRRGQGDRRLPVLRRALRVRSRRARSRREAAELD